VGTIWAVVSCFLLHDTLSAGRRRIRIGGRFEKLQQARTDLPIADGKEMPGKPARGVHLSKVAHDLGELG
jgi:hypothetical protein